MFSFAQMLRIGVRTLAKCQKLKLCSAIDACVTYTLSQALLMVKNGPRTRITLDVMAGLPLRTAASYLFLGMVLLRGTIVNRTTCC